MRLVRLAPVVFFLACRADGATGFIPDRDGDGVNEDQDCDDGDSSVGAPTTWYEDADGDGHGDPDAGDSACGRPVGYVEVGDDCDDGNAAIYPGAEDVCDGLDNDCDGIVDNGFDSHAYYVDADGDGYGDDGTLYYDCEQDDGAATVGGDCDDSDAAFHPGAAESCTDPNDYNCDGSTGYADTDGDGWVACEECDDGNAGVNPDAAEVCDGVDNDCDGLVDDADDPLDTSDGVTVYYDLDGDGYGDPDTAYTACEASGSWVTDSSDCDDGDSSVNPAATETCNGIDDDCDGLVDDADDSLDTASASSWYTDADGDGYGDDVVVVLACEAPSDGVSVGGDCDDADPAFHPGATESCTDPNDYNCDGSTGYSDADGDGWVACEECDDGEAAVNPDAEEVCDGVDNDCDGSVDVGASDATAFYADSDGDGYGDADSSADMCDAAAGWVADASDCDDTALDVNPGELEICNGIDDDCDGSIDDAGSADTTTWFVDVDGDGYGDDSSSVESCTAPIGYVSTGGDCDDLDTDINPSALEWCDGVDNDCDGSVDEADAADAASWYADADADGYGDAVGGITACDAPAGYVADSSDCDDTDAAVNPGATEVCDGADNDCDGSIDEGLTSTWYADTDGDGYGDGSSTTAACTAPAGYVADGTDCDDAEAAVNPGAAEICDGLDNDCDGLVDDSGGTTWYADADLDGYGDASTATTSCSPPVGYVADGADCDDSDSTIHPGAVEVCDGVDNDCDGTADSGASATWYADADGDGYGDASSTASSCTAPAGYVGDDTDCDDADLDVNPGADELCNGIDDDCDGLVDDDDDSVDLSTADTWYADDDGDGFGDPADDVVACDAPAGFASDDSDCDDADAASYPGADEYCDLVDNDCDGTVDEDAVDVGTWYADADGDGYGDSSTAVEACDAPAGWIGDDTDCDDGDAAINPAALEVCDALDNDCNGTADDGGVCPCPVEEYDGHSYMFCSSGASWTSASSDCELYGYELAAIGDTSENTWVADTAWSYTSGKWWVGLNDRATEGTWEWSNGEAVSYTNWAAGSPATGGGGRNLDCGMIGNGGAYTWKDHPCTASFAYVCEE
jgi:large repetitive protein